jgi:hypothetical protein
MKKLMTMVLGAALACGMVTVSLAQEKKEEPTKKAPKKGGKKKDGEKKKEGTR